MLIPGYDDLTLIGRGGFAHVYRARQQAFDREVAVKVLLVSLDEERDRRRFERECAAMGRLTGHPHIVTVLESGVTPEGNPYLTTPYYPDGTLADRISRDGPFGVDETLATGVALAGALDLAHRVGILHRDVKPANVLLSEYGEPALADFGIASIAAEGSNISQITHAFTITHAPPEILEGHHSTEASDIYALASTLWTMLAGAPPFGNDDGEGIAARVRRVQHEPVPPMWRDDVPPALDAALRAALAKRPEDRPPSASAFGERLREVQRERGGTVTPMLTRAAPVAQRPSATSTVAWPAPDAIRWADDAEAAATSIAPPPPAAPPLAEPPPTSLAPPPPPPTIAAPPPAAEVPPPPPTIVATPTSVAPPPTSVAPPVPPTVAATATRHVVVSPPPAPPPSPTPAAPSEPGGRTVPILLGAAAAVVLVLLIAFALRSRSDGDPSAASTTTAVTTAETTTAPGPTDPSTTAPSTTAPAPTTAAPPSTAPASPATPGQAIVPADAPKPVRDAATTAQSAANALAAGDWKTVRKLIPSLADASDAALAEAWGGLDQSTLVVTDWNEGAATELRLGQVAQEESGGAPRTSLYCVTWSVRKGEVVAMADQQVVAAPWRDGAADPAAAASVLRDSCSSL